MKGVFIVVNIIYQNTGIVRFTSFDINTTYNLADLRFFIPTDYNLLALYCVIKNTNDKDSVELIPTVSDNKFYNSYIFSNEQSLSLESGLLTLFLFGVTEDKATIVTNEFDLNLQVDNFNIMNDLYAISKLNIEIANYYNKIVELTKQNINILSDVQELKNGGGIS
jgi:hypothetical protein